MSRIGFVGTFAAVALLAGCGGPDATAMFAAKATAICESTMDQLAALSTARKVIVGTPAAIPAKEAALVAQEVPIDQAELRRLGALAAPASERNAYAAAVAEARDDVALPPLIADALRHGRSSELNLITQQSSALSAIAIVAMTKLGLHQCTRKL